MKTTNGKSKSPPRQERPIAIVLVGTEASVQRTKHNVVATVQAKSLREGLQKFFEQELKPTGCYDPMFRGNTMSVKTKFHIYKFYDALEPYQVRS